MLKKCTKCGRVGPLEDFPKNKRMPDGHINQCWPCRRAYMREYVKRPDPFNKHRTRNQSWRARNREKDNATSRKWQKSHPEKVAYASRKWYFKRYGLTPEQADQLKANGCWVCGATDRCHIDHDHSTVGTYRGVLCSPCNTALGLLKEDSQRIQQLVLYTEGKLNGRS